MNSVLTSTLEDYLESIFILQKRKKAVRVKDIVKKFRVSVASVVEAIKRLQEKNLVVHERYGYIELTHSGILAAQKIYKKHEVIIEFFTDILGLPFNIAEEEACKIEHFVSKETLKRMNKFTEFFKKTFSGKTDFSLDDLQKSQNDNKNTCRKDLK